ncbi:MAG: metallophosphoesterase [Oscillospiraceae bacterium]|nr:metallophosphoesterase [Oscillospiraceae bacterium]
MVYVMSDIHGNKARFDNVIEKINLQPEDTLYILGDVIDRFPDGIKLIRRIMRMPNVKMILGNHEYMMLNALYYSVDSTTGNPNQVEQVHQDKLELWYHNGGEVTHSYLKRIRKSVRQEIYEFLVGLPLNIHAEVDGQKFLLIHGGVEENYEAHRCKYDTKTAYAVWARNSHLESIPEDTILIFGHTPTIHYHEVIPMELWQCENYINIDCGSGYEFPGRLCCLRLEDGQEFYSDN